MSYRSATDPALQEAALTRDQAERLERRITAALPPLLAPRLRERMDRARRRAQRLSKPTAGDEVAAYAQAWERYRKVLERVVERAPRIERRYNLLPRGFPKRLAPRFGHSFFDIYDVVVKGLRGRWHAELRRLDSEARFTDERRGYFDRERHPYLVEARFRVGDVPFRLHLLPMTEHASWQLDIRRPSRCSLLTTARQSAPKLRLTPDKQGVLTFLGVDGDVETGDPDIDGCFHVEGDDDAIARALHGRARVALIALANSTEEILVELEPGSLRIEWLEPDGDTDNLSKAVAAAQALRKTKPVSLLQAP